MNYSQILRADLSDGLGVRVSLFVSGCHHHCPGCFNSAAWDENAGLPYTQQTEDFLLKELNKPYIRGLSLLGGEPLEPSHINTLYSLVARVKKELPQKDIWVYSGYTFEELQSRADTPFRLLKLCDILVDGRFEIDKKDLTLPFRGSSNQRIIDLTKSTNFNPYVI